MTIQHGPNELRWRVHLNATPDVVYERLSTDRGRESFWAESSKTLDDGVSLVFPDRSATTVRVLLERPPHVLEMDYFGVPTRFVLEPAGGHGTVLEVTASRIPAHDMADLAAGWVSVLLNLKAAINFGGDLRNHARARTWVDGFVDN
jgi:hypothetical protein